MVKVTKTGPTLLRTVRNLIGREHESAARQGLKTMRVQVTRIRSAMVKVSKQTKVPGGIAGIAAIVVGSFCVLGMLVSTMNASGENTSGVSVAPLSMILPVGVEGNAKKIKSWRQGLRDQCLAATSIADVDALASKQIAGFALPTVSAPQPRDDKAVKLCRNVVMDFGANIGDTSGHVVDTGMISCDRTSDLKAATQSSHFNIETKQFELVERRNRLTQNLEKLMLEQHAMTGPEDYCYYGVEGNPHFTERLQNIEDFVMAISPRPVQHMHFFTESVGAGQDGMTKLYLDTVNTKENFWGSSIFKDHQDVRRSAEGKDVETVAAPVMGYTIGTLMRKTMKAFDPTASESEKKGSHLVLKVDIEGGEYPLLHQAVEEGTLCEFVKMGNTADLFIEFHSAKVTGKHDFVGKTKELKETLTACGVTFRNLAAFWA